MDDLIEQVQKHAESLTMEAEDLTNQYSNITANSEDALTGKTNLVKIRVLLVIHKISSRYCL